MISILKIRLQASNCANGDYLNFYQMYSLQLETNGVNKIVILRCTGRKFGSLIR